MDGTFSHFFSILVSSFLPYLLVSFPSLQASSFHCLLSIPIDTSLLLHLLFLVDKLFSFCLHLSPFFTILSFSTSSFLSPVNTFFHSLPSHLLSYFTAFFSTSSFLSLVYKLIYFLLFFLSLHSALLSVSHPFLF